MAEITPIPLLYGIILSPYNPSVPNYPKNFVNFIKTCLSKTIHNKLNILYVVDSEEIKYFPLK